MHYKPPFCELSCDILKTGQRRASVMLSDTRLYLLRGSIVIELLFPKDLRAVDMFIISSSFASRSEMNYEGIYKIWDFRRRSTILIRYTCSPHLHLWVTRWVACRSQNERVGKCSHYRFSRN